MISAEGPLPFPRDRFSWVIAAILFVVLMAFYYGFLYGRLEDAYREGFVYTRERQSTRDNTLPVIRAAVPRYLSGMTDRKLFVSVTNPEKAEGPITLTVIPVLSIETENPSRYYVFLTSADIEGNVTQNGLLTFESVPPGATIAQEATLRVMGPQGPNDKVLFELAIVHPDGTRETLELPQNTTMTVDPVRSLLQNLVAFVLLPPWANGFIPLIALFSVYLFGLVEARRRWPYKGWQLWFWLFLLALWANLLVFSAAEFAISILNDQSYSRPLLVFLLFLGLSLYAWRYGHTRIDEDDDDDRKLTVMLAGGEMTIHISGLMAPVLTPATSGQPRRPSLIRRGRNHVGGFTSGIGRRIVEAGGRMAGNGGVTGGEEVVAMVGGSIVVVQENASVTVNQAVLQTSATESPPANGASTASTSVSALVEAASTSQQPDEAAQTTAQDVAQPHAPDLEPATPTTGAPVVSTQTPTDAHAEPEAAKLSSSDIAEDRVVNGDAPGSGETGLPTPAPVDQIGAAFTSPPPTGPSGLPSEGEQAEAALKVSESIIIEVDEEGLRSASDPESEAHGVVNLESGTTDVSEALIAQSFIEESEPLPGELADNPSLPDPLPPPPQT